jgi:hypothetical protein
MSDPLATARAAQKRAELAEAKAKAARDERDKAVVAAFRAGAKPPSIHRATGIGEPLIRKIIRENKES